YELLRHPGGVFCCALEIAMQFDAGDGGAERRQAGAEERHEWPGDEQDIFQKVEIGDLLQAEHYQKHEQDDRCRHEAADDELMQQLIDAIGSLARISMIEELALWTCDFVDQRGVENAALIVAVERGGRQADFTHGGAGIPKGPKPVAFGIDL